MILFLGTTPAVQRVMTFERVTVDDVNRASNVVVAPAGKSINAARIAKVVGAEDVLATGFLGGDTGELIRQAMANQNIRHDFVTVTSPTRVCVTVIDRAQNHTTELIEEHAGVTEADTAALLERVKTYAGKIDIGVLSGSLAPGVPANVYTRCMKLWPVEQTKWIIDARGDALRYTLPLRPFVVKPNASELSATVNLPVDTDDQLRVAIRALLDQGPTWAVVTRGPKPVVVSDGRRFFRIVPPVVKSVSPIGAGDAFAGSLAAALSRGDDMQHACAFATAVAAASTLLPLAGDVILSDVKRIEKDVRVESM